MWLYELTLFVTVSLLGYTDASTYAVVLLGIDLQPAPSTQWPSVNTHELVMINPGNVAIDVEIKNISGRLELLTIGPEQLGSTYIEEQYSMNGTEHANKTLIVSSRDDFTLQVFSSSPTHTEGYMGIPLESLLGPHQIQNVYEYVVSSYCAASGYCQMALAAFEKTEVKLTFPANRIGDIVFCVGTKYFRSNRDHVLSLEKFHAVQIETTRDLSGTHIYSFRPIVVIVGTRNITVAGGTAHMVEQLSPASQWGNNFAVTPLNGNEFGDLIRISATWVNTRVDISGYQSFLISKSSDVVTRRLAKDSVTFITASHPIQVIQITGVTFATDDESISVAMVTVPAIEHATSVINIACGSSATLGRFQIVSARTDPEPSINGIQLSDEKFVDYTPYQINMVTGISSKVYEVAGTRFSGMVICANNAVIPLLAIHDGVGNDGQEDVTVPTYAETTCIEGASGTSTFTDAGQSTIEYEDFGRFSVLKLRVMVCGSTRVTLLASDGGHQMTFRLMTNAVEVTMCYNNCLIPETFVMADGFNSNRNCLTDMAWYWVRVSRQPTTPFVCFGFGPVVNMNDTCEDAPFVYMPEETNLNFDRFSLAGIFTEAYFNYDLETEAECAVWVSSWRCADKIGNCSSYGKEFCSSSAYETFATDVCPKYCKKCTVDSYGRKFIFPIPAEPNSKGILVAPVEGTARIGVVTKETVLRHSGLYTSTIYYYVSNGLDSSEMVWLISDKDVGVSIVIQTLYETATVRRGKLHMNNVYPIDSFSTEFLLLTACEEEYCTCDIVTDGTNVDVVPYSRGNLKHTSTTNTIPITDGHPFRVLPYHVTTVSVVTAGDLNKGTKLQSNKSFGVFCGSDTIRQRVGIAQMVPIQSHGTVYRLSKLNLGDDNFQHEFTLRIQAVKPNTEVSISGESDTLVILESFGQIVNITIDADLTYEIKSNYPIAVGLLFVSNDLEHAAGNFILIPPVNSYVRDPVRIHWWNNKEDTTYVTTTGKTGVFNNTADLSEITDEKIFGITMFDKTGYNVIVPTFTSLSSSEQLENLCTTSTGDIKDGIDNDCDGLLDEDLCSTGYGIYGKDGDMDGDFGGDCSGLISEPVVVPIPQEPVCIHIEQIDNRCRTICSCPCSWLAQLQAYEDLTQTERLALQADRIKEIQNQLKMDVSNLTSTKYTKLSVMDKRQSAASIGYVGLGMFTLVFGSIFLLDVAALLRDARIFCRNLRSGFRRLRRFTELNNGRDMGNPGRQPNP